MTKKLCLFIKIDISQIELFDEPGICTNNVIISSHIFFGLNMPENVYNTGLATKGLNLCELYSAQAHVPANTGHSPYADSMLGQRRRRWANIESASGECPVFSGCVRQL